MITLLIITSVFLVFITGILFFPLKIIINTQEKQYFLSLPGYFRIDLLFTNQYNFGFRLKVFFFSFRIEPGKKRKHPEKTRQKQEKSWNKKKMSWPFFRKLIQCFRIKRFHADIDTGNFPLNAQLIPVAQQISHGNIDVNINFENRNNIDLYITTKLHRIAFSAIKYKFLNN